uniref:Uncharacterized protein n=1 Tax=Timspurckia oligopyrenoides TaxID=708627 RepID=A0A7S1EU55_9RHOD|mmetsp:Transcript_7962/g.14418  ORF Transcript_7962/g.14418 Transcript_7962/m.14418 type:complete len:396 (+) Transcript_7962:127-1314(+)
MDKGSHRSFKNSASSNKPFSRAQEGSTDGKEGMPRTSSAVKLANLMKNSRSPHSTSGINKSASFKSIRSSLSVTSISVDGEENSGKLRTSFTRLPGETPVGERRAADVPPPPDVFTIGDDPFEKFSFNLDSQLQPQGGFGELRTFVALPHDGLRYCFRVLVLGLMRALEDSAKYWTDQHIDAWRDFWVAVSGSLVLFFKLEEAVFFANLEGIANVNQSFDVRRRSLEKTKMILVVQKISSMFEEETSPDSLLSSLCYGIDFLVPKAAIYLSEKEDVVTEQVAEAWPERSHRDAIDRKVGTELVADDEAGPDLCIVYTLSLNPQSRWKWRKNSFTKMATRVKDITAWETRFTKRLDHYLNLFSISHAEALLKDPAAKKISRGNSRENKLRKTPSVK